MSLYYTEKNLNFVRVFFKILYTLFTFEFMTAKKYPSIIRRKIQVLLMCFERKFTNYFRKTKIFAVLPWANKAVFKELWCNPDKGGLHLFFI